MAGGTTATGTVWVIRAGGDTVPVARCSIGRLLLLSEVASGLIRDREWVYWYVQVCD